MESAGDGGQPVVAGDHAEIGAVDHRRAGLWRQAPAEPHAIMMDVDVAGATEPVPREPGLDILDHGVDAGEALAFHHRVDIAAGLGPGARDQLPPTLGVGLVPHRDVALDQVGERAHGLAPSVAAATRVAAWAE